MEVGCGLHVFRLCFCTLDSGVHVCICLAASLETCCWQLLLHCVLALPKGFEKLGFVLFAFSLIPSLSVRFDDAYLLILLILAAESAPDASSVPDASSQPDGERNPWGGAIGPFAAAFALLVPACDALFTSVLCIWLIRPLLPAPWFAFTVKSARHLTVSSQFALGTAVSGEQPQQQQQAVAYPAAPQDQQTQPQPPPWLSW